METYCSDAEENEGILTLERAKQALGDYKRSHDNTFGFTAVHISDLFMSDIDVLKDAAFARIQFVDVSKNCLRTLEALLALPELRILFASDNQLETTDSIPRHKYLDTVDLSRNFLAQIGDWSSCPFLRHLFLRSNAIREISGFEAGPLLETLDISDNQITELAGLSAFQCLERLDISDNQVTDLEGVGWNGFTLIDLNISGNQIRSLKPFTDCLGALNRLDVSRNLIVAIEDCSDNLKHMDLLADLQLSENPVVAMPHYRLRVIYGLQRLSLLDGVAVDIDEVVQAKNAYGVFVAEREKLWKSVHADAEFVDRRALTENVLNDTNSSSCFSHVVYFFYSIHVLYSVSEKKKVAE